jgi:hypothetical protein
MLPLGRNPLPFQAAGGTVSPAEHPWIVSQTFLTDLKGASPLMAELVSHRRDMFLTKADPPSYSFGMAWARGAFRAKSEESSWMIFQVRRAYKVWWFQLCEVSFASKYKNVLMSTSPALSPHRNTRMN